MRIHSLLAALIAAPLVCSVSLGQGADDCSNAQAISGLGTFGFSNVGASIDGPFDCGGQPVRRDIWFRWTAPSNGGFKVTTCGGTTLRTRLAIYDGVDCVNYPLISCVGGTCTDQSDVAFLAQAGNEYLIRLGSRFVGESGSGTFDIRVDPCPLQADDVFEDNDVCTQATPLGNGTFQNLTIAKTDADYYSFPVADGGTLQVDVLFSHADGDIDMFLLESCTSGGTLVTGGSGTDNEQIIWTNALGCDTTVLLRVEHWLPDTNADCNTYEMMISGSGGTGTGCTPVTLFCEPANPNSTGLPVTLVPSGSFDATTGTSPLHLEAINGPSNLGAYFLVSTGASASLVVSDGVLCLDQPQGRYNPAAGGNLNSLGFFDANGVLQNASGTSTIGSGYDVPPMLPNPPGGSIMSGQTWYFQVWYRDLNPGTVSNFSNGLAVTFN